MELIYNIDFLLICNAFIWLIPPFFYRGLNRYYLLIVAALFSQSYWTYVLLQNIFDINIHGNIVEAKIPDSLYYSLIAGVSFAASIFFFTKKRIPQLNIKNIFTTPPLKKIPKAHGIAIVIRLIIATSLFYSYVVAINQIGISDRITFMDSIRPFWYTTLLPLNTLLLGLLIAYDIRWSKKNLSLLAKSTIILIFLHIILVGFDGSRRYAIMPIIAMGFAAFSLAIDTQEKKPKLVRNTIYVMIASIILSTILIMNRSGLVGWQMFNDDTLTLYEILSIVVTSLFAPMPTIHVNTQMAELTDISGAQGYHYYFYALGNTLFPNFIFQKYFFGDPLVVVLHQRFGWYGQDFGFLAEAIYAGKTIGVVITHFLFGLVVAKTLNNVHLKKLFFIALAIGILFGMSNSLRSDFMNILKSSLYSSIIIYMGLRIISNKKNHSLSTQKTSENTL